MDARRGSGHSMPQGYGGHPQHMMMAHHGPGSTSSGSSTTGSGGMGGFGGEREAIQKQIQSDWANREYIEIITGSIKKITDFLNSFDASCRGRIASLNERLTQLERKIDYLEARISRGDNTNAPPVVGM